MHRLRRQNKTGFTLIELLVAIAIFSIIILIIYSSFYAGISTQRKIRNVSGIYQNCRVALDRLSQDLENSFPYSNEDSGFKADSRQIEFFSLIPKFYDQSLNQPQVFKVKYQLSNGVLTRSLYPVYDQEEVKQQIVLSNVEELKFSYPFAQDFAPFYEWSNTWQIEDNIPQGVKVELSLIDIDTKESFRFSRIIFIPQGVLGES